MKSLILTLACFFSFAGLAEANPCRATNADLAGRDACIEKKSMSGVIISGDWHIHIRELDGDGSKRYVAVNAPVSYYGSNRKSAKSAIHFFCSDDVTPVLLIDFDSELKNNSKETYSFDNDGFTDFSDISILNKSDKNTKGIVGITDVAIIEKVFTKSLFSVRATMKSGELIEMIHTLDKGAHLMHNFRCLGYVNQDI